MKQERKPPARLYLRAELALLFFIFPALLFLAPWRIPKLPLLGAATLYCVIILAGDKAFDRSCLAFPGPLRKYTGSIALASAVVWVLTAVLVIIIRPSDFMAFPLRRPLLWLIIFICYPFLSALPQEFIYRVFFFHRYAAIIPAGGKMIIMSSAMFAFVHIVYGNLPAVVLSLAGGFLFSRTYVRSRSLAVAAAEHALYGLAIFTVGLGRFFYAS